MRVRCLRSILPIDQTFTITYSNTEISERWHKKGRVKKGKENKHPNKIECTG